MTVFTALNNRVGGYQNRACVTEMGALDSSSLNYQSSSSNTNICFIQGVGAESQTLQIGNIYWPMWKDGDGYRLFVNTDNGQWVNWSLNCRACCMSRFAAACVIGSSSLG